MTAEDTYEGFLDALEAVPNATTIGPSYFSTMQDWPLPAFTVDLEAPALGQVTEEATISLVGLTFSIVIHVPIDLTNLRSMPRSTLCYFDQIIPLLDATFPDYKVQIADPFWSIVPFGRGEAFGLGFTVITTSI